jgi:glutamate formiminotransferase
MWQFHSECYLIVPAQPSPMDDITLLAAASCAALAILVYFMWRAATKPEWQSLTATEKKEWRIDEEKRKEEKRK